MKLWRYGQPIEILGKRYLLDGVLGSGGMAEVCSAWDEQENRRVAIKILKTEEFDQQMLNRFIKEAGQIVGWQHPNILRVYDHMQTEVLSQANNKPILFYIVLEFASGGDLQKRMTAREPYYSLSEAFTLFRQVCGAVQYAHKQGVIHRDIKPLNILFRRPRTGPEEAVLSDFGLAVQVDASHHTFANAGTLAYMAPEQLRGHAQPASDIFALGVTLYQLITGYFPFQREIAFLPRVLAGSEPAPILPSQRNPDLPPALDEPILKALQAQPSERHRSAAAFWNELAAILQNATLPSETRAAGLPASPPLSQPLSLLTAHVDEEEESRSDAPSTHAAPPLLIPKPIILQPAPAAAPVALRPRQPQQRQPRQQSILKPLQARKPVERKRFFLLTGMVALLLFLLVGVVIVVFPLFASAATITIVPRSQLEQHNDTFTASQVQAHQLEATASPQTHTGNVSGTTSGKKATGKLTFINQTNVNVTLQSMTINGPNGIAVTFQGPIVVNAINPSISTITGIAANIGTSGNIPQFALDEYCCAPDQEILVKNTTAFTGGENPEPNDSILQKDIDQAAQPLITTQTQQQKNNLQPQVQKDERVINSSVHCVPTVTPDSPVGTQAKTVTVTVSVTCTEEVYHVSAMQTLATAQLSQQAMQDLGASYQLSGPVTVTAQSFTTNGVTVQAQGLWAYHFTAAQLNQFTASIANKNQNVARSFLLSQPGIAAVQIPAGTLPSADHIHITVQHHQ